MTTEFKVGDKVRRIECDFANNTHSIKVGDVGYVSKVSHCGIGVEGYGTGFSPYLFELVEDVYPHYDVVTAWMEGKDVEILGPSGCWVVYGSKVDFVPPFWKDEEYRIKPEESDEEKARKKEISDIQAEMTKLNERMEGLKGD